MNLGGAHGLGSEGRRPSVNPRRTLIRIGISRLRVFLRHQDSWHVDDHGNRLMRSVCSGHGS